MTRMRVHELAKELNMNNKDLLERLIKLGIQAKNHMSTLTDSAVEKIRLQFAESKAEKVEEKRIGRAVIRRRKKTEEEAIQPSAEAEEGIPSEEVETEVEPFPHLEATAEEPVLEVAAELPEEPVEVEPQITQEPFIPPKGPEVEEPFAATERDSAPEPEPEYVPPPQEVEPDIPEVVAHEQPSTPLLSPEEPESVEVEADRQETSPAPISGETIADAAPQAQGADEEPEESEESEESKAKKAKKRRRKKGRKDEPARIIKLPELLVSEPDEPEEEPLVPAHVAVRLQVKPEEPKEISRKKRTRPEEPAPAIVAPQRAPRRKEVFERKDLYSKKELAAQDDRGRGGRDRDRHLKEVSRPQPAVPKIGRRKIKVDEAITLANLAKQMGVKAGELIKKLLLLGITANINQALDFDTAALIAGEFEFEVEKVGFEEEEILQVSQDTPEDLLIRPPVVTVMGHVDHGKTSLLDAIRHTDVIGGEAGGITQHIGAYYVKLEKGDVVFLDTPGHEAFTSMRARGAKVTDLVILVVAADDGVMQQTVEAINHAKAAEVPIIVAINKIDKPNANLDRVKRELADQGLIPEEWGGQTTMVEISAKKLIGIEDLLEMVLLQSEILELKANPNKPARGHVIEAKLDKGRGPVATILIQEGTLKTGDVYLCGVNSGKVRNMFNDKGQRLEAAGPSTPVEVLGLSGVPNAGDDFFVLQDEKQAKIIAEHRLLKAREKELTRTSKVTLESLFDHIQEGEIKELKIIVKSDVHGSLEALIDSLNKLSTHQVKVSIIHSGTGAVTESDIMLASASNAITLAFNVRSEPKVQELADTEHVDVRYYDVIYQLLDDVRNAMVGLLEPTYKDSVMGRAEVRQTFQVPKMGTIAGSYVLDGRVERNARVRVLRDNVIVYDGKVDSLRRFKDDAREVKAGFECGIGVENFNDIKVGDILEVYELLEVKATSLEPEHKPKAGS